MSLTVVESSGRKTLSSAGKFPRSEPEIATRRAARESESLALVRLGLWNHSVWPPLFASSWCWGSSRTRQRAMTYATFSAEHPFLITPYQYHPSPREQRRREVPETLRLYPVVNLAGPEDHPHHDFAFPSSHISSIPFMRQRARHRAARSDHTGVCVADAGY